MENDRLIQETIERFWDTIPPVWGKVRSNVRETATSEFQITLVQFHLLRHIYKGAHSASEVAERQQISRPAITQAVDLLVEKGLVNRSQNLEDRRYVRLELTPAGTELVREIYARNRLWMADQFADLQPEDLETLIAAMDILKKSILP